jgi:hypothetical protein
VAGAEVAEVAGAEVIRLSSYQGFRFVKASRTCLLTAFFLTRVM